jgi:hypothetical protein
MKESIGGLSLSRRGPAQTASQRAKMPAASESRVLSVSICRMIRPRLAPRAERIAISRDRRAAFVRNRLAALAQAISSTRPTTAIRSAENGTAYRRNSGGIPTIDIAAASHPLLVLGKASASCRARTLRSA